MRSNTITHVIYISSDYQNGNRIALHFIAGDFSMHDVEKRIKKDDYSNSVSIYTIETESKTWDSVLAKDAFYENVICIGDVNPNENEIDRFNIRRRNTIHLIDVALLILSFIRCNYVELIIYLYHCYCEYTLLKSKIIDNLNTKIRFDCLEKGPIYIDLDFGDKSQIKPVNYPSSLEEFNKCQALLKKYQAKNADVIASKFVNSLDGAEIMNDLIGIILKLRDLNITELFLETINEQSIYSKNEKKPLFVSKSAIRKNYKSHF